MPCDPVDLPDLRYLDTDYALVKHPFKPAFDIESYNSMWFDQHQPSTKPPLSEICADSLPPKIITDHILQPTSTPRPDTINEMTAALSDNGDVGYVTDMTTESPILSPTVAPTADSFHKKLLIELIAYVLYPIRELTHLDHGGT